MANKFEFTLEKLNLVVNWDIDTESKKCTLCQRHLLAPSPVDFEEKKDKKKPTINGYLLLGACGHIFHESCINTFLSTNMCTMCPTDKTPWSIQSKVNNGAIYNGDTKQVTLMNTYVKN